MVLLFLLPLIVLWQSICGTDEYNSKIQHRGPLYQLRNDSVDLTTQYKIPIVVHIVENDSMKVPIEVLDSDVHYIIECINSVNSEIDLSLDGWVSVNDILIEEGHAYDYHGGKKKDFKAEIKEEKENQEKSVKEI